MQKLLLSITFLFSMLLHQNLSAQDYSFDDFVGTWHGYYSSETGGGTYVDLTMVIYEDGFYTDSSGEFMPNLYPNTQECDYEASTNRMHWWYLQTVYAGQYFYQHFYYDVVYFEDDTLEMHYNYWDDDEPHPNVGTLYLVKENLTPPPLELMLEIVNDNLVLEWDTPSNIPDGVELESYHIYYAFNNNQFDLLANVTTETYTDIQASEMEGDHYYYVSAIYNLGESDPSETVHINNSATAINKIADESLIVFPNPANGFVQVQSDADIQNIHLFNISGKMVNQYQPYSKDYTINLLNIEKGIYILKIFTHKGVDTKEVLVQ